MNSINKTITIVASLLLIAGLIFLAVRNDNAQRDDLTGPPETTVSEQQESNNTCTTTISNKDSGSGEKESYTATLKYTIPEGIQDDYECPNGSAGPNPMLSYVSEAEGFAVSPGLVVNDENGFPPGITDVSEYANDGEILEFENLGNVLKQDQFKGESYSYTFGSNNDSKTARVQYSMIIKFGSKENADRLLPYFDELLQNLEITEEKFT